MGMALLLERQAASLPGLLPPVACGLQQRLLVGSGHRDHVLGAVERRAIIEELTGKRHLVRALTDQDARSPISLQLMAQHAEEVLIGPRLARAEQRYLAEPRGLGLELIVA